MRRALWQHTLETRPVFIPIQADRGTHLCSRACNICHACARLAKYSIYSQANHGFYVLALSRRNYESTFLTESKKNLIKFFVDFLWAARGVKGHQKSNFDDRDFFSFFNFYFRFGLLAKKYDSKLGFVFLYFR